MSQRRIQRQGTAAFYIGGAVLFILGVILVIVIPRNTEPGEILAVVGVIAILVPLVTRFIRR